MSMCSCECLCMFPHLCSNISAFYNYLNTRYHDTCIVAAVVGKKHIFREVTLISKETKPIFFNKGVI